MQESLAQCNSTLKSAVVVCTYVRTYARWRSRMAKREREEEFEVSEVTHPSSSANVKGVVKKLSPMKKKKARVAPISMAR